MEVTPLRDEKAEVLLPARPDQYIELQISKLLENSLNYKLAAELLRHAQGPISEPAVGKAMAGKAQLKNIPIE
jgi:hypothetical protein